MTVCAPFAGSLARYPLLTARVVFPTAQAVLSPAGAGHRAIGVSLRRESLIPRGIGGGVCLV